MGGNHKCVDKWKCKKCSSKDCCAPCPTGPTGIAGTAVNTGATGPTGPASGVPIIPFGATGVAIAPVVGLGSFIGFGGAGGVGSDITAEPLFLVAPHAGTLQNLFVNLPGTTLSTGASVDFTIYVNGAATALTVNITEPATSGSNTVDTVLVAAGDTIGLFVSSAATVAASVNIAAGVEFL